MLVIGFPEDQNPHWVSTFIRLIEPVEAESPPEGLCLLGTTVLQMLPTRAWLNNVILTQQFLGIKSGEREVKKKMGASLVVQWLRIHLPMQGTRARALVWEDPTSRGATKPVHHNY